MYKEEFPGFEEYGGEGVVDVRVTVWPEDLIKLDSVKVKRVTMRLSDPPLNLVVTQTPGYMWEAIVPEQVKVTRTKRRGNLFFLTKPLSTGYFELKLAYSMDISYVGKAKRIVTIKITVTK